MLVAPLAYRLGKMAIRWHELLAWLSIIARGTGQ
jgi:hypothetical protein